MAIQLWIYGQDRTAIAPLEDYETAEYIRRLHEPGPITLRMSARLPIAQHIQRGRVIGIHETDTGTPDLAYLITRIERRLDTGGDVLTAMGKQLSALTERRLIVPLSGTPYDEQNAAAETVMKAYVANNLISDLNGNTDRQVPGLVNAPDQGRGASVTYRGRFQTLAVALMEIGRATGLGFAIELGGSAWEFDVIRGVDRSVGNGAVPPIIFSPEFGNLESQDYHADEADSINAAYIGGTGTGGGRTVLEYFEGTEPSGFGRREYWADARDLDTVGKLQDRGAEILAERGVVERLTGQVAELFVTQPRLTAFVMAQFPAEFAVVKTFNARYRALWDLGDIVTVSNEDWDVDQALRIVEVRRTLRGGEAARPEVTFADRFVSLPDRLRQEFRRSSASLRQ